MTTKICEVCSEIRASMPELPLPDTFSSDGRCKACNARKARIRRKTKEGFLACVFANMVRTSKQRGHRLPDFTQQELTRWALSKLVFSELFENYKLSDYAYGKSPSFDRIDDYKPYTLSNLRIVTWRHNNTRAHRDKLDGTNTKDCKAVICVDTGKRYPSMSIAGRTLGISFKHISAVCRGIRKTAGKCSWRYADD